MEPSKIEEVIGGLKRFADFVEVEEIEPGLTGRPRPAAAFLGIRRSRGGEERRILIELFDSGKRAGRLRYYFKARPEGQSSFRNADDATGNPEPSIIEALTTTHWDKLGGR